MSDSDPRRGLDPRHGLDPDDDGYFDGEDEPTIIRQIPKLPARGDTSEYGFTPLRALEPDTFQSRPATITPPPRKTSTSPQRAIPEETAPARPTPPAEMEDTALHPQLAKVFKSPEPAEKPELEEDPKIVPSVTPVSAKPTKTAATATPTQAKQPASSFTRSIALTIASTVIPGLGLLWAPQRRLRRIGAAAAALTVCLVAYLTYAAFKLQRDLVKLASNESFLTAATPILAIAGLVWVTLITITHLATRPAKPRSKQRLVGALVVTALTFSVAAPTAVAARYARDAFLLVNSVLPDSADVLSSSRPSLNANDPWANIDRVNFLLLGADGDASRADMVKKYSVRTDTIMVASVDTKTGDTLLIQIPRNVQYTPFPEGSEMYNAFPRGFRGQPAEDWYVNSILANVELNYPDLMKGNTYRGAEALKLGIQGITGLKMDYFVMLNIDGLRQLIDAMGGVTVNVNERLPIGGNSNNRRANGWIEPGPDQHLDGYHGLWFARSRWSTSDYDRMRRQSCLVDAIIKQANPTTLLTRFESIAAASSGMLQTDIPSQDASAIIDLAFRVKDSGRVTRLVFSNGQNGYSYANPDFVEMRTAVEKALNPSAVPVATPTNTATATATKKPSATKKASPSASASNQDGTQAVSDACAYTGP